MKKFVQCKSLGIFLPEKTARKVDEILKTIPKDCPYQRKAMNVTAYQFEPGERAEVSIITSATVDKSNEVVLPQGLDRSNYNGTVLYNHDKDIVVGDCKWLKFNEKDETLRAKTEYFENVENVESRWYKFVDEVWTMVKAGALKAKSIGFQPLVPLRDPTAEELAAHPEWDGAGVWEHGLLLEYSVCPVGVNNDAMVELVNTKSVCLDHLKQLGINITMPEPSRDMIIKDVQEWVKAHQKPKKVKKQVTEQDMIRAAVNSLDANVITARIFESYKNRGRV